MIRSIQQFEEISIKKLEKCVENFSNNPKDMASFVYGVRDEVITLALNLIGETLQDCDQMLRSSLKRKQNWEIVRTDEKRLTTSIGEVTFEKTYFRNKETGEYSYLLDRLMGLEKHERLTEDADAKLLEEAVQTSYRRAGEECSLTSCVSRQTTMNKLHELRFPEAPAPKKKKVVDYLYIDADEDHVSLQFQEQKGDLVKGENHYKNNCAISKLVYVYEGVEPEAPKSKRHRLVEPHYFSGTYPGKQNQVLWDEVSRYLDSHYDLAKVKKIYLNGDGGAWIQSGKSQIRGLVPVLDEFHLRKYLLRMTAHMADSAEDARKELCAVIRGKSKEEFVAVVERLKECTESVGSLRRIDEGRDYIISNWMAARTRLARKDGVVGCSAEGHVSHVLSWRMSSRPMGWSRRGVDQMSHLLAYHKNGGDMLELVRYQKEELPAAVGAEEKSLTLQELLSWERAHRKKDGKYFESIHHGLFGDGRRYAGIRMHIWGL